MTEKDNGSTISCSDIMVYNREIGRMILDTNVGLLVFHSIFALAATFQNLPVIYAIVKTPSLHNPPNILLCSLATSDLLLGCAVQPLWMSYNAELINGRFSCALWKAKECFLLYLMYVSIITLVMISTERWLALHFHLRYREIVTVPRTLLSIASTWFFSGVSIATWPLGLDFYTFTLLGISVISIAALILVITYVKIFVILRRHMSLIENQARMHQPMANIKRHKRSSATMLYVVLLFFLFYSPTFYTLALYLSQESAREFNVSQVILWEAAKTVALVSASANPALYYWKMKDIRRAVRNVFSNSTVNVQMGDIVTQGSGNLGNDYRSRMEQRKQQTILSRARSSWSSLALSKSDLQRDQQLEKEKTETKRIFLMPRYLEPGPSFRT